MANEAGCEGERQVGMIRLIAFAICEAVILVASVGVHAESVPGAPANTGLGPQPMLTPFRTGSATSTILGVSLIELAAPQDERKAESVDKPRPWPPQIGKTRASEIQQFSVEKRSPGWLRYENGWIWMAQVRSMAAQGLRVGLRIGSVPEGAEILVDCND